MSEYFSSGWTITYVKTFLPDNNKTAWIANLLYKPSN